MNFRQDNNPTENVSVISTEGRDLDAPMVALEEISPFRRNDRTPFTGKFATVSIFTRIILVLFFALSSLSGFAEDKPLFGYVDVSQAVMFHPLMASFKVKEGRFSPTVLKTATPDRDQVRKQLQKKRDTLQTRISDLEKQLRGIDQDYKGKLEALAPLKEKLNQYRKEPPVSLLEEYNTRKGTIDRKYWQQRETVTLQIQQANQEMQDTLRENSLLHLTTPEETSHVFKMMLDDVYAAISAVAKHYKVQFVFNSSFSVDRTALNPSFTPENPLGSFFNEKVTDPKKALFAHGEGGKAPLFMSLQYWNGCQRWALRDCVEPRLDRMILMGGVSMTGAVVDFVLQKYDVDKAHREVLQDFFASENKAN